MLLVSKILNSESNSQPAFLLSKRMFCCCWYQRYWILKAIHNRWREVYLRALVVVGIKDTEFWKQFTTCLAYSKRSNSCCWYQRYWILKAIHNTLLVMAFCNTVVVGIKDTEFWKQFTTHYPPLRKPDRCCWYQRYWILKAIHNICEPIER